MGGIQTFDSRYNPQSTRQPLNHLVTNVAPFATAFNGSFPDSFSFFSKRIKTVDFSGIRTRIVKVEGEQADHLTTTTVLLSYFFTRF